MENKHGYRVVHPDELPSVAEAETALGVTVDWINDYESGQLDEEDVIAGFQSLINTGYAWTLQGHYGRTAAALIEAGLCQVAGGEDNE